MPSIEGDPLFCTHCGTDMSTAAFCPHCGAPAQQPPPQAYTPPTTVYPAPVQQRSSGMPVVLGVLVGVLVFALLGGGVLLYLQGRDDKQPVADPTPVAGATKSQPKKSAHPSARPARPAKKAGPRPVSALPAGLFCRDLDARGYSYVAAANYWNLHGNPNQMDADRNGIPCETVYPPSDVSAYWGSRTVPQTFRYSGYLPDGLFCRDLYARGLDYADAVSYWWREGAPDRMDEDLNGIPCETVYPSYEISSFWS